MGILAFLQGNVFSFVLTLKLSKKIVFWGKTTLFAGLVTYIVYVLRQQPFDWAVVSTQFQTVDHPKGWGSALLLLTPVNWGLEALKWQILLRRIEKTTYWNAYQGVLAGVSLGFALPTLLGDTAGRVLTLQKHRTRGIGASLVSGGVQFYVALVFGAVAWAHYLTTAPARNTPAGRWLLIGLVGLSLGGIGLGLVRRRLIGWLSKRPVLSRFAEYWTVAGVYDDAEIALALGVAAGRYLVFSLQFYVALRLMGIGLPTDISASGIGVVFLVKTITPAFNLLSDLGVREAASLWVWTPFGVSASVLLMATLTLWLVNVFLPVVVGLIWVWKLKWKPTN